MRTLIFPFPRLCLLEIKPDNSTLSRKRICKAPSWDGFILSLQCVSLEDVPQERFYWTPTTQLNKTPPLHFLPSVMPSETQLELPHGMLYTVSQTSFCWTKDAQNFLNIPDWVLFSKPLSSVVLLSFELHPIYHFFFFSFSFWKHDAPNWTQPSN